MMALHNPDYRLPRAENAVTVLPRRQHWQREAANSIGHKYQALTGKVTEVVVHDNEPQTLAMLLPLLAQLSFDQRWFLWVAPPQTLAKPLLQQADIDLKKVMLLNPDQRHSSFQLACKALRTGTSHIALCAERPFTEEEMDCLKDAARLGQSHAIVIRYC